MSWRWLIDVRGPEMKVDGKRLLVAVCAGLVASAVLVAVLPAPADLAVLSVLAVTGIAADVVIRRRHPEN